MSRDLSARPGGNLGACIMSILFCSSVVLNPRVGHTMNVLSPFISVLCHSNWVLHGESCPRLDVVHPGCAWSSSPVCTWHCSLHYLWATSLFHHGVTIVCYSLFAMRVLKAVIVLPYSSFVEDTLICFLRYLQNSQLSSSVFSSQMRQDVFLHSFYQRPAQFQVQQNHMHASSPIEERPVLRHCLKLGGMWGNVIPLYVLKGGMPFPQLLGDEKGN